MYEGVATLKGDMVHTFDEYGNEVLDYTERTVYVKPRTVYASEFYSAAQIGLQPSIVLTIAMRADYHGEKIVEYEGKIYDVIRSDFSGDTVSLTLTERIGHNGD